MTRKTVLTSLILLAALAALQAQDKYLDVYYTQIKPEKRAEFDAVSKKIAAANRKNNGDSWFALETVYGTGNRVSFISLRDSYGEIEKANAVFYGAVVKAYGQTGAEKLFQDFGQCLLSTRGELRRFRFDLSSNAPADSAALAKLMGETRWLRTSIVHLKPGQTPEFESLLKDIKAAGERSSPALTIMVAQAVAGQEGTVFYITVPEISMAGFDGFPSMRKLLGDEGLERYMKAIADTVQSSETVISRIVPELSNPSPDVAAVAPDFWNPKPAPAAPPKKSEKK